MKNKSGYTLVELVVALSLLSIIIVFMLSLLVDLKAKETKAGVDTKTALIEATLSKTINSDINNFGVVSINELVSTDVDKKIINIDFKNNTSKQIKIENDKITYGTEEEITIEKELPEGYYVKNIIVENTTYGLKKLIIEAKNKKNNNLGFNIEAYSYENNQNKTN